MEKKISVIVPVYNKEKYLAKCIESILDQTYRNIELILVNDGSTDNSMCVIKQYAQQDDRIQVIDGENHGVSHARNLGFSHAGGQYVMFVDADDAIVPRAIEILYCDAFRFDADIASGLVQDFGLPFDVQVWCGNESIRQCLRDDPFTYSSCAKLYKRDFIENVRFDEQRKIHEDSFFVFQCCLEQPVFVAHNAIIYHYENDPQSASRAAFSEKFFDILHLADQKKQLIEERYPELEDQIPIMLVKENLAMLHCFCNVRGKQYLKEIKDCIRTVKQNKNYFLPAVPGDQKWFWIITHNLFFIYRALYRMKHKK